MGTLIKSVATSLSPEVQSSITHAVNAGYDCLAAARVDVEDINLLLNVGIYRDTNLVEPAISALIQKELRLNLDYVKNNNKKAAVSFDLMNGACGPLNAVQVASAFLATGSAKYVLVVASDAHPSNQAHHKGRDFYYGTLGSAMLLEWSPSESRGFGKVHFRSSSDGYVGLESYTELYHPKSKESLTFKVDPEYKTRLLDAMTESIQETAKREAISLNETLLITSQLTSDFGVQLTKRLGMEESAVVRHSDFDFDPHTSAMALGYSQAIKKGIDPKYRQILFAAGGSGLSTGCVVYRWE